MSTNFPAMPEKTKSFWDKPEGLWGMILGIPIVGALLWGLSIIVPLILSTFLGILGILVVGIVIAVVGVGTWMMWPNLILKYEVFCRKLRRSIIDENPITILRMLQTKAKKRLEEFNDLMSQVNTARRKVETAATRFSDQLEDLKSRINLARRKEDVEDETRYLSRYEKTEKYRDEQAALAQDIAKMSEILLKAKKVCENVIEDSEWEITNKETRLEAVKAVSGAWGNLRSIFKGNADDNDLRDEAMRAAADQMESNLGRIDTMMEEFKGVLQTVGEADEINAEKARLKLANLQNVSLSTDRSATTSSKVLTNQPTKPFRFTDTPSITGEKARVSRSKTL